MAFGVGGACVAEGGLVWLVDLKATLLYTLLVTRCVYLLTCAVVEAQNELTDKVLSRCETRSQFK